MKSQKNIKRFPAMLLVVATLFLTLTMAMPGLASPDTVTLNPNGPGDITIMDYYLSASDSGTANPAKNWQCVLTEDGDDSWINNATTTSRTDLYSLGDVSLTGTINSVTVYISARVKETTSVATAKTVIKTTTGEWEGAPVTLGTSYPITPYSTTYTMKPGTTDAWTWGDINALQAGVSLIRAAAGNWSRCTRVWVVVEYTPEECQWYGETAWADGDPYNVEGGGNWATYTTYDEVGLEDVMLYAGQTLEAGTVDFSAPADGWVTITITLNPGWRFKDTAENVKIQDYEEAPSGNPAPGQFNWKRHATESPFSIVVPANAYYGVHVDVEREVCL